MLEATARLRLFALQAVAQTETLSISVTLQELPKLLSPEKEGQVVENVCSLNRTFEAPIPILNATEIDDVVGWQGACETVHWAFGHLREQLNKLAPVASMPMVAAPELSSGAGP